MKDISDKITAFFADEQGGVVVKWALAVSLLVFIAVAAYSVNLLVSITGALADIANSTNTTPTG